MWLIIMLICCRGSDASKSDAKTEPSLHVQSEQQNAVETTEQPPETFRKEKEQGLLEAQKNIASGDLQILVFGEATGPKEMLDSKTGLPESTMGCELTPKDHAYATAYNEVMKAHVSKQPPFPVDMIVTYSVYNRTTKKRVMVQAESSRVRIKSDDQWQEISSRTSQRLKIGVWAQRAMGVRVPAGVLKSDIRYTLTVTQGTKNWNITWGADKNPPANVQKTVDALAGFVP